MVNIKDLEARLNERGLKPDTVRQYRKETVRIIQVAGPNEQAILDRVKWEQSWRTQSSFNKVRVALVTSFDVLGFYDLAYRLDHIPLPPRKRKSSRTSGRRQKKVPQRDINKILSYLYNMESQCYFELADLVLATCVTGVRAMEWPSARLIQDEYLLLEVRNAKNDGTRAHGAYRQIELIGIDKESRDAVIRTVQRMRQWREDGESKARGRIRTFQNTLTRVNRRLWPRRQSAITLHSCRHQFAANAKSVHPPQVVGGAMGHASAETCQSNYAKRRQANGLPVARPTVDTIENVRDCEPGPRYPVVAPTAPGP